MTEILTKDNLQEGDEDSLRELFGQLSDRAPLDIHELLTDNPYGFTLVCHRSRGKITGMASMGIYKVISGFKGWIEDVVVDPDHRGSGIGKALILHLLNYGKELELGEVLLFTEDEKKTAIQLYLKLGFQPKDSQLFHIKF